MLSKEYKEKADEAIIHNEYTKAINFYTLAIKSDANNSTLYSGRAKAYYKHNQLLGDVSSQQWKKMLQDCNKAILLDKDNYDAAYYLGLYYADATNKPEKGLKIIKDAYKLSMANTKKQKSFLRPQDIYLDIFRVREQVDKVKIDEKIVNSNKLFSKVMNLLELDYHKQIDSMNQKNLPKEQKDYKLAALAIEHVQNSKDMIQVFKNSYNHAMDIKEEEPPEHLTCPITFQLMHDPVISPSGISYEKSVLMDALLRNPTDPFTRQKVKKSDCYPNKNLKKAADEYVKATKHSSS